MEIEFESIYPDKSPEEWFEELSTKEKLDLLKIINALKTYE